MATPSAQTLTDFIDGFARLAISIQRDLCSWRRVDRMTQAEAELNVLFWTINLKPTLEPILAAVDGAGFVDWSPELEGMFGDTALSLRSLIEVWGWDLASVNLAALRAEVKRRRPAIDLARQQADAVKFDKSAAETEATRRHVSAGLSMTNPEHAGEFRRVYDEIAAPLLAAQNAASTAYHDLKKAPLVGDKPADISEEYIEALFNNYNKLESYKGEISRVAAAETIENEPTPELAVEAWDSVAFRPFEPGEEDALRERARLLRAANKVININRSTATSDSERKKQEENLNSTCADLLRIKERFRLAGFEINPFNDDVPTQDGAPPPGSPPGASAVEIFTGVEGATLLHLGWNRRSHTTWERLKKLGYIEAKIISGSDDTYTTFETRILNSKMAYKPRDPE